MDKQAQKDLLVILALTSVFGIGSFFLAKTVDRTVAEVIEIRNEINEETRIASEDGIEEEVKAVDEYRSVLEDNLSNVLDIIEILEQLENMASITQSELSIQLEEGTIGGDDIEFEDEKEKEEFLKNLEVKEYTLDDQTESQSSSDPSGNVALDLMQEGGEETQQEVKISYLEIDLNLKGSYDNIRTYISLLQDSYYFFNIKEIRLNKIEAGQIEAAIKVRAFIFE